MLFWDDFFNETDKDYTYQESEGFIEFIFSVAGLKKEDINIDVNYNTLKINYKDFLDREKNYVFKNQKYDLVKTEANVEDGLLKIKIPIKEENKPLRIEIK